MNINYYYYYYYFLISPRYMFQLVEEFKNSKSDSDSSDLEEDIKNRNEINDKTLSNSENLPLKINNNMNKLIEEGILIFIKFHTLQKKKKKKKKNIYIYIHFNN